MQWVTTPVDLDRGAGPTGPTGTPGPGVEGLTGIGNLVTFVPGSSGVGYSTSLTIGGSTGVVTIDIGTGATFEYNTSNPTIYLSGDILPTEWPASNDQNGSFEGATGYIIGSYDRPIKSMYISNQTLYIGSAVLESTSQGTLVVSSLTAQKGTSLPGTMVSENYLLALGSGDSGQYPIQWSADGIAWLTTFNGVTGPIGQYSALAWNGTTWVVGGNLSSGGSFFLRSPTGFNWERAGFTGPGSNLTQYVNEVAHNNNRWIAVGSDVSPPAYSPNMVMSTDSGLTWFRGSTGASLSAYGDCIASDGINTWVAGGSNGGTGAGGVYGGVGPNLIYSIGGIGWTGCTGDQLQLVSGVCYGGGKWLAIGPNPGGPKTISSNDGITWSYSDDGPTGINQYDSNFQPTAIAYNGSQWIVVGQPQSGGNFMYVSSNGRSWSFVSGISASTLPSGIIKTICWNGSQWIAAGYLPFYSTDNGLNRIICPFSFLTSVNGTDWYATDGAQFGFGGQVSALSARRTLPYTSGGSFNYIGDSNNTNLVVGNDAGIVNKLQLYSTASTIGSTGVGYTGPNGVGLQSKFLNISAPPTPGISGGWKYERLPGTYSANLSGVTVTGNTGQFSCTGVANTYLRVGQKVGISGPTGGATNIVGYVNPSTYIISATNGSTTFTLRNVNDTPIATTPGTPTGLSYGLTDYTMTNVTIVGNTGQISTGLNFYRVGQYVTVTGTNTGTGSIPPGSYSISQTNGSTGFTLAYQTPDFAPVTTSPGTTTGLTFTLVDKMVFTMYNPYYPTQVTGAPIVSYTGETPRIKKKNVKSMWAVITPSISMPLTGTGTFYLFFNLYTFDNVKGSSTFYTNRFDYNTPRAVENFSNETSTILHAGVKYLVYAKDNHDYVLNPSAVETTGLAMTTLPFQLTTEMLKDPYDIYTNITHVPFSYNFIAMPRILVYKITGVTGQFNGIPIYIAGGATPYLSDGQQIMILGGPFTNGTIIYPPHTAGNLYIVDGAPTPEIDGTVTFTLKTIYNEPLVTTITSPTTLASVAITGTGGQFSSTTVSLTLGQTIRISGTPTGNIVGYTDPTTYQISAIAGSGTSFTLTTLAGGALTTTAGATTGLTFTGWNMGTNLRVYVNPPDINDVHVSQMALTTSSVNATNLPIGFTVHSMGFNAIADDSSEVNVEYNLTY